jgi:outer membrane biosynthesis protein TonB
MPSLETPPSSAPPGPPVKVRTGRFGELEEHEIIHLLDSLDDERAKARFREAIYISVIIYLALGWFVLYGPRVLFHQPRLINPMDVLKDRDKMTYLNMPKEVTKEIPHKPTDVISDKNHTQQTTRPTLDKKTLEQLQAMRRAGPPAPTEAPPTPQPPQQQPAPQQQAQQSLPPAPAPAPQQQARVDTPTPQPPTPQRPNFGNQNQSAGEALRQAARQAAQNRGGGDYGAGVPVAHQGINTGVDVLSDTMGVDFGPYLNKVIREIYTNWIPLIPEEARPPLNKSGETPIRFTILPNGTVGGMHLDGSTHDDALNRAAWGSVNGQQFPPLPPEFKGPLLELRIHYMVNKNPE